MKLKFTRSQIIVLIIAFVFILYGLAQAMFKFTLNKKIVDDVSFVLLIGAFILIFNGRKKKNKGKILNTIDKTGDNEENKAEDKAQNKAQNKAED